MINIGFIAAFLTTAAFIPQVIKTLRSGSTKDLSLATFLMMFLGVNLWAYYGYIQNDRPLLYGNLVMIVLMGIILFMKIKEMMATKP